MGDWILPVSFFLIALIYSSVGFGGGSSYLALLALPAFSLGADIIRPTSLLCNLFVVTGSSFVFITKRNSSIREIWPYIILSIPLAWLGGFFRLTDQIFFVLLASVLCVSSLLLWIQPVNKNIVMGTEKNTMPKVVAGGFVGFLSGLVSIGGGIFLSPFIHLLKWEPAKKIPALSAVFILVNSVSGLLGQFMNNQPFPPLDFLLPLLLAVLIGGQLGSRLGLGFFNPVYIRRTTSIVVFLAAILILRDHL